MAFTSSYEGFGMLLLEAMTQRLPVVSTPVGCARALVTHERTGLVVPCRDADVSAALGRMLDDRALQTSLAERAFDSVRDMTWTRSAVATLRSTSVRWRPMGIPDREPDLTVVSSRATVQLHRTVPESLAPCTTRWEIIVVDDRAKCRWPARSALSPSIAARTRGAPGCI
jgi:hypothetical protein